MPNILYTPDERTTSQVAPKDVSGKNGVNTLGQITMGDDNDEDNDANNSNKVEYVGPPLQEGVACQLTYDSPTAVVQAVRENRMTTYPKTFCSSEFSTLTVQQAWDCVSIAHPQTSLGNQRKYNFLWPRLRCTGCCFLHGELYIQVGDKAYMHSITYTNNCWVRCRHCRQIIQDMNNLLAGQIIQDMNNLLAERRCGNQKAVTESRKALRKAVTEIRMPLQKAERH